MDYFAVIHVERFTLSNISGKPYDSREISIKIVRRSGLLYPIISVIKKYSLLFWSEMKIGTVYYYKRYLFTIQLYCVKESIVAKLCLCFVMYDFDENNITNYLFVDVKQTRDQGDKII